MAETVEQTIPVVETTAEETPKVVEEVEEKEETNGHTENGNGTTEVKDVDETTEETNEIHKDADYENGGKLLKMGMRMELPRRNPMVTLKTVQSKGR